MTECIFNVNSIYDKLLKFIKNTNSNIILLDISESNNIGQAVLKNESGEYNTLYWNEATSQWE